MICNLAKHEKIVEKGQSHPPDQQILAKDSDFNVVYKIAAEHTFIVVPKIKETAHVLSTSAQPEETSNTHNTQGKLQHLLNRFHCGSILLRPVFGLVQRE